MKVCYVTHKPNLTGANRSLLDLLDGLDRDRYEPVVLVNRRGPLLAELKKRDIPYKYALIPPTLNSDNRVLDFLKRVLNSVPVNRLCVETVKLRLRQIDPDLVHNNSLLCSVGMQAARELKLPYLCHFRDFLWEDHHRKLLRPKRVHKLMDDADVCISISGSGTVKEKFQPFVTKEVVVIQDGIHTELYDLPLRPVLKSQTVNLLMAGRLHPGKGQLDAVKAVELARQKTDRDLRLHILGTVGDPAYAEELHEYVESRGLDYVSIEDFVNDLSALREACDIGLTCDLLLFGGPRPRHHRKHAGVAAGHRFGLRRHAGDRRGREERYFLQDRRPGRPRGQDPLGARPPGRVHAHHRRGPPLCKRDLRLPYVHRESAGTVRAGPE